jgi:hypothetical protein
MIPRWTNLSELDRLTYRAVAAFLAGRLEQRATVEWALRLPSAQRAKREAVLDLVDGPQGANIREPWRTGWRLIEESWNSEQPVDRSPSRAYYIG